MGNVRNFAIAVLFSAAVFVPAGLVQAQKVYFVQARPLVSEIGAYTDASYSSAAALSAANPTNLNYKKAVAHAKTADDMQNAIEGLWYWSGANYPYEIAEGQSQEDYDAAAAAFLATYTYDPIFTTYYIPLRKYQALYSQYAANDIVNGKGRKWTASSLLVYNYCSKAASLGAYDALQP